MASSELSEIEDFLTELQGCGAVLRNIRVPSDLSDVECDLRTIDYTLFNIFDRANNARRRLERELLEEDREN